MILRKKSNLVLKEKYLEKSYILRKYFEKIPKLLTDTLAKM